MHESMPNISEGLWQDLKTILEYMVVKDKQLADSCETETSKHDALVYFAAVHHRGSILLYKEYMTFELFATAMPTEPVDFIQECLNNPLLVPEKYRANIIRSVEEIIINNYVEKNDYYRTLIGLPPYGTKEEDFIFLNDKTYEEFGIQKITVNGVTRYPAIHELDKINQSIIEKSPDFQQIKKDHPEAQWLDFIDGNSIPLEQARNAYEFEIIRLFPSIETTTNPLLTTHFSNEYNRARTWITKVMWNADLEQTSISYRQFVAFAILIKALRMTLNRQFDGIIENSFLNDTLVNILFDLYRLPQSLHKLPKENRRRLALELRKIIRDRASNKVLYDVARILGFDNIVISKIVLTKMQIFEGEDQRVVHKTISNAQHPITGEATVVDDPYHSFTRRMQAIDLKCEYPNEEIISNRHIKDYLYDVTIPDPRWWEDNDLSSDSGIFPSDSEGFLRNEMDEIKKKEFNPQMFKEPIFGNPDDKDLPTTNPLDENYDPDYWDLNETERRHPSWFFPGWNTVDTKYLMLTYHYSMSEKMFEMIYLMRFLLDKKRDTTRFKITLPEYGGKDPHSLFDIILFLVCGLNRIMFGNPENYTLNIHGEIIGNQSGYRSICGYNVDLSGPEIESYLNRCSYLDKTVIYSYIDEVSISEQKDLPSAFAVGILGLRDYLITKMETATTIGDWREAEKFYNMMFTYDPIRDIYAKDDRDDIVDGEYVIPDIRYKIYDMEVSKFGSTTGEVGDAIQITLQTSLENETKDHTIVVGFVSKVENGLITEVEFRPSKTTYGLGDAPVWDDERYNTSDNINLISDKDFDIGDKYNPSGLNGPSIESGSYKATVNGRESSMYIRVTTTRFHTKDLYDTYIEALISRDPFLADYISGSVSDKELAMRLNEACNVISEIMEVDLNFMKTAINGGEDMEKFLMDMIRYIKSYTIDFITSEKSFILNDKHNPEWLRAIDGAVFNADHPTILYPFSPLMIYDAIRHSTETFAIFDGKDYPRDEWDYEPFTTSKPKISDRIDIIRDNMPFSTIFHYIITEIKVLDITFPDGLKRGDLIDDTFIIRDLQSTNTLIVPIKGYIGNNPPEGFYESEFRYMVDPKFNEMYSVWIQSNNNNVPFHLKPNFHPDYGQIISSENRNFILTTSAVFSRRDTTNPQYHQ